MNSQEWKKFTDSQPIVKNTSLEIQIVYIVYTYVGGKLTQHFHGIGKINICCALCYCANSSNMHTKNTDTLGYNYIAH